MDWRRNQTADAGENNEVKISTWKILLWKERLSKISRSKLTWIKSRTNKFEYPQWKTFYNFFGSCINITCALTNVIIYWQNKKCHTNNKSALRNTK
jgi:hypothetical protein